MIEVPGQAARFGFVDEPMGTHSSRTIMLSELRGLLTARPGDAHADEYRQAVVEENVLLKGTLSTRAKTFRHLRELYALDGEVLVFRVLRELWHSDIEAQPLLALLCSAARDPIVRATADAVLKTPPGGEISSEMLAAAVSQNLPGRYNEMTLARIGRNCASSWEQSGHLKGRMVKTRSRAEGRPATAAYALLLGYLCGARGEGLFNTLWCRMLDAPSHQVREHAIAAAQQGWLEYRHAGEVTEISFRHFLGGVKY